MPLIRVPEHTPEDLAAWDRMEREDAAWSRTGRFRDQVSRSMDEMAEFASFGPCYVSVSWGKDSVAVAHLACAVAEAGGPLIPLAWFREEPTTNPHCELVRDEFLSRWDHPYLETALWLRWNESESRWDDTDIDDDRTANEPVRRWNCGDGNGREGRPEDQRAWWASWWPRAQQGRRRQEGRSEGRSRGAEEVGYITGIRADESGKRKLRVRCHGMSTRMSCAPIAHWTARDVYAYMWAFALPVHPAYAMSFGGRLDRARIRVSGLSGDQGTEFGRREWERHYYGAHIDAIARRA